MMLYELYAQQKAEQEMKEATMQHTETKKKVQQHVNKSALEDVHYIRQAYNLPCGTCVYSEYCNKAGVNKANFRERIIEHV